MKYLVLILFLSQNVSASLDKYFHGYRSYQYDITVAPVAPQNVGDTVEITGEICKQKNGNYFKSGKCKKISKNKVEIRAFFPDMTTEVTGSLNFSEKKKRLKFNFTTQPLSTDDLNKLTITVGQMSPKLHKYARLRDKILARIVRIEKKLNHLQAHGVRPRVLAKLGRYKDILNSIANKLLEKINAEGVDLLAFHAESLYVGNQVTGPFEFAAVTRGFKLSMLAENAYVVQGNGTPLHGTVTKVEKLHDSKLKYKMEAYYKGQKVSESTYKYISKGESLNVDFVSGPLFEPDDRKFKLKLYAKWWIFKWKIAEVEKTIPRVISVDVQDPLITLDIGTDPVLASPSANISVQVDDESFVSFDLLLNGILLQSSSEPQVNFSLQLLEGQNVIEVRSTDANGNSASLSKELVVDTIAPAFSLSAVPDVTGLSQVTLQYSISDANPSGVSVSKQGTFLFSSDGGQGSLVFDLIGGDNQFEITASDQASNSSPATVVVIHKDEAAPTLSINLTTPIYTNQSNIVLPITATDRSAFSIKVLQAGNVLVDGSDLNPVVPLVEGSNTLSVIAEDIWGNISQPVLVSDLIRDTVLPEVSGEFAAVEDVTSNTELSISYVASDLNFSRAVALLNGSQVFESQNTSFTVNYSLVEGENTLEVKVYDLAGNFASVTKSTVLDTIAPSLTVSTANLVTGFDNAMVNITAIDQSDISILVYRDAEFLFESATSMGLISVPLDGGENSFEFVAVDAAGNQSEQQYLVITRDDVAPVIAVLDGTVFPVFTNQVDFNLPLTVSDISEYTLVVKRAGVEVSTGPEASAQVSLVEGENIFTVVATDIWGNVSAPLTVSGIHLDQSAPLITTNPASGSTISFLQFGLDASFSEPISELKIDGEVIEQASLPYQYMAENEGPIIIQVEATDLAGNVGLVNVNLSIETSIMRPQLIVVKQSSELGRIDVVGFQDATSPGAQVTIATGSENQTITATSRGEFFFDVGVFSEATLTVSIGGVQKSTTLNYDLPNRLSGCLKDSLTGMGIANVKVQIGNTQLMTYTDGDGVFQIDPNGLTGFHDLMIDGTSAAIPGNVTPRKYSGLNLEINLGADLNNVIPTTIFINPILLDGSQILVQKDDAVTVSSSNAPGFELEIEANSMRLPAGAQSAEISITTTTPDRSTVPAPRFATPQKIYNLEPSGVEFSTSAKLTLPNDDGLPVGADYVIFSMNSKTGRWEIDGTAEVIGDGSRLQTKDGQGITHFSQVYAVPVGFVILPTDGQTLRGIDSSSGGAVASISLPSFKISGQDITPRFEYNSNWAHPNVVVKNYFDIPKAEVRYKEVVEIDLDSERVDVSTYEVCWEVNTFVATIKECRTKFPAYWYEIVAQGEAIFELFFKPESIRARFSIDNVTYPWTTYNAFEGSAILGYHVDENLGLNLETGVYRADAEYEIQLDSTLIRTINYKTRALVGAESGDTQNTVQDHITEQLQSNGTYNYNDVEILQEYSQILPDQITSDIYIKNLKNSEFGKGWNMSGLPKIVGETGARIQIDGGSGAISSFTKENSLVLVEDFSRNNPNNYIPTSVLRNSRSEIPVYAINFVQETFSAPDLPTTDVVVAGLVHRTASEQIEIIDHEFGLDYQHAEFPHAKGIFPTGGPPASDLVEGPGFWQWRGTSRREISDFLASSTHPALSFGLDRLTGSLFVYDLTNKIEFFPAKTGSVPLPTAFFKSDQYRFPYELCLQYLGNPCIFSSADVGEAAFERANRVLKVNLWALDGTLNTSIGLSRPEGLGDYTDSSGQAIVLVADTGNHLIKSFKIPNNVPTYFETLAGNGQNHNGARGVQATSTGVAFPTAVEYGGDGIIYIGNQDGELLRRTADGVLRRVAGNPSGDPDIYENDVLRIGKISALEFDEKRQKVYIADKTFARILSYDIATGDISLMAGGSFTERTSVSALCIASDVTDPVLERVGSALCHPEKLWLADDDTLMIFSGDRANNSRYKRLWKFSLKSIEDEDSFFIADNRSGEKIHLDDDGRLTLVDRNDNEIIFGVDRKVELVRSATGQETAYLYDGELLSSVTYSNGKQMQINYSGGCISNIVDPAGRSTSFSCNSGKLEQVSFSDGSSQAFGYDIKDKVISITAKNGGTTQVLYNQFDRVRRYVLADGSVISVDNADVARLQVESLLGDDEPLNITSVFSKPLSFTDANGNKTEAYTDFNDQVFQVVDPQNRSTKFIRDELGRVVQVHKHDGEIISYTYHEFFNKVTRVESSKGDFVDTLYNERGNILSRSNHEGENLNYEYVLDGRLVGKVFLNGDLVESREYTDGLLSKRSTFPGPTLFYFYDGNGNVFEIRDDTNTGPRKIIYRDQAGNATQERVRSTDGTYIVKQYVYDDFNRLTRVLEGMTSADQGSSVDSTNRRITSYEYSYSGKLIEVERPDEKSMYFSYDERDFVMSKTDFSGRTENYKYDGNGNMVYREDYKEEKFTFAYNSVNNLTKKTLPDDVYTYMYDQFGQINEVSNSLGSIKLTSDPEGRLLSEESDLSVTPNYVVSYSYDGEGNLESVNDSYGRETSMQYDIQQRLRSVQSPSGRLFGMNYDGSGRLTELTVGSLVSQNFTYDVFDQVEKIDYQKDGASIYAVDIDSNKNGLVESIETPEFRKTFQYDDYQQLTGTNYTATGAPASVDIDESYSYNLIGDRTSKGGVSYSYNHLDQLTSDGAHTFTYDGNGNLIQKDATNTTITEKYYYNSENQMINYEKYDNSVRKTQVSFKYDPLGRRVVKDVFDFEALSDNRRTYTRKYLYQGENVSVLLDKNSAILSEYVYSGLRPDDLIEATVTNEGALAGIGNQSGVIYPVKDHLGTIIGWISGQGTVDQHMYYSSFGEFGGIANGSHVLTAEANHNVSPYHTFTGREYDVETGLYYYRARYYDPGTGRFVQEDPHPGAQRSPSSIFNRYLYAANNPLSFVDPSGASWLSDLLETGHQFIADVGATLDGLLKNKDLQIIAILVGSAFTGGVLGTLASGSLGLTGGLASVGSVVFGAVAGGVTSGALFSSFGLGTFREGFRLGALAGALGGYYGFNSVFGQNAIGLYNNVASALRIPLQTPLSLGFNFGTGAAAFGFLGAGVALYQGFTVDKECSDYEVFGAPAGFTGLCE